MDGRSVSRTIATAALAGTAGRSLSRTIVAAALAGWLALGIDWQPAAAFPLPGDPSVALLFAVEQTMLDLTNADRLANGLDPLDFDFETLAIARTRAASQLGTASLNHYDANGDMVFVQLLAEARLDYQLAGENLARASRDTSAVTGDIEQALMQSPPHRRNILERTFHRVAIGAASNAQGQITLAEVYRN